MTDDRRKQEAFRSLRFALKNAKKGACTYSKEHLRNAKSDIKELGAGKSKGRFVKVYASMAKKINALCKGRGY